MHKQAILRQKFQQYSQKAILSKMPPEFIGIAKQYGSVKKQRIMSQQLFDSKQHELSSIQKINQSLQKSLKKKKQQLKYFKNVRDRYVQQSLKKQRLSQIKKLELSQLRNRNAQQRYMSEVKLTEAKKNFLRKKKSQYEKSKKQLSHYKSQKNIQQSLMYQSKQSRVRQIQDQKERIRQYNNRYFQNKNKKFMQSYKQMIGKQKSQQERMKQSMKNLQQRLLKLKQKASRKQKILNQITDSITSLRQSRQGSRISRFSPNTRSMTPLQIISGTSTAQNPNPQRKRLKLLKKT